MAGGISPAGHPAFVGLRRCLRSARANRALSGSTAQVRRYRVGNAAPSMRIWAPDTKLAAGETR